MSIIVETVRGSLQQPQCSDCQVISTMNQGKEEKRNWTNLLCNAAKTTSRPRSGKILVSWAISSSDGARTPALARSVLPVSSFTHSRITLGFDAPAPAASGLPRCAAAVLGVRAVVITSGSLSWLAAAAGPLNASSGRARFERRGGRREPIRGRRYLEEKRTMRRGRRQDLSPARSER